MKPPVSVIQSTAARLGSMVGLQLEQTARGTQKEGGGGVLSCHGNRQPYPRSRWWWLGYQGLGVVMAGSTDDYLSWISVLKQQLLCLPNKTGGSGLCYIVNLRHFVA